MKRRSAGVVPVRRDEDGDRVLILRCYKNWDFPKGLVAPGEDALATAIREAREEADLDDLTFPWGAVFAETAPYSRGKVARYYLAATAKRAVVLPINPALGHPEHHEGRWVTPQAAQALLPARLQPILAWAVARLGGRQDHAGRDAGAG